MVETYHLTMGKPEAEALREWLEQGGYPLEYLTAREMTRAGFKAWQGMYYEDPDSGERREFDVRADEPDSLDPWRPVFVVAECKNNSKKPWIVLTTTAELEPGYGHRFLVKFGAMPSSWSSAIETAGFVLNMPPRHGFSVVQSHGGEDAAYAAMRTVVKAARDPNLGPVRPGSAIALPVIVLGGSLYQLGYKEDGSELLEPVLWQRVVWRGADGARGDSVQLDLVTQGHLPAYLRSLRTATKGLAALLADVDPSVKPLPMVKVVRRRRR